MELYCPLGISRFVAQDQRSFFECFMPYNKSFIDQAFSVKVAGYWPRSFFICVPIYSHLDRTSLVNNTSIDIQSALMEKLGSLRNKTLHSRDIVSLSRLVHLVHVVECGRSILKLNWYNGFRVKIENERFTFVLSRCRQNLKIGDSVVQRAARMEYVLKCVSRVHLYYFSSFSQ